MTLEEAIQALRPHWGDALIVHANGHISRRSFNVEDRRGNFYMIGSMGLASSIGLGVAVSRPERQVIVLDGDGNLLMNLGVLASISAAAPRNLLHIVLDNGVYGSTGNQPSLSRTVDLAELARAAGYARVARAETAADLARETAAMLKAEGPSLLLAKITPEPGPFTAARVSHSPQEIRDRFSQAIAEPTAAGAA